MSLTYRADIDGLRAIAVSSVILAHTNSSLAPGGFVGVDIFFVISGYLITAVISKELELGSFSYVEFYRRRIKRLFPVLITVIIATIIASQIIFIEPDNEKLANSAVFSILFSANIYFTFFVEGGYFAESAELQPLLHLWSLGVEEQFYIIWPLALTLISKKIRQTFGWAIGLIIFIMISTILAQYLAIRNPTFSYYMLPTRAGELMIGALSHLIVSRFPNVRMPVLVREFLVWFGSLGIMGSIIFIGDDSIFPGVLSLPSTLGAAAIICAGSYGVTSIGWVLSRRPFVFIGLLSYSLYLWHWPVLSFYRYIFGDPDPVYQALLIILVLALSYLSYIIIETPFRRTKLSFSHVLARGFVIPLCVVVSLWAGIISTNGLGWRYFDTAYQEAVAQISTDAQPANRLQSVCQHRLVRPGDLQNTACLINTSSESGVLLWGDSNMAHYVPAIAVFADEYEFSFRNVSHGACPPFVESAALFTDASREDDCRVSASLVSEIVESYDVVMLSASWDAYARRRDLESVIESLTQTIRYLRSNGTHVIVLGRIPRIDGLDRRCAWKRLLLPFLKCEVQNETSRIVTDEINDEIRFASELAGAEYFDFNDVLCGPELCSAIVEGSFVYYDSSHLSASGSRIVGEAIVRSESVNTVFGVLRDLDARGAVRAEIDWEGFPWKSLISQDDGPAPLILRDYSSESYGGETIMRDRTGNTLSIPAGEQFAISFRVYGDEPNTEALVRIDFQEYQSPDQAHILVAAEAGSVRSRMRLPERIETAFNDDGTVTVRALFGSEPVDTTVRIRLFASVTSTVGGPYTREATGELRVDSLQIALAAGAAEPQH